MPVKFEYELYEDSLKKEMEIWIKSLDISLKTNVKKTMITMDEWIQRMVLTGMKESEIESRVKDAFLKGSGPFATFRNTFIRRTAGSINLLERVPRDIARKPEERFTWVCLFVNSCDDCMALHGDVHTWSEWLDLGLPGSGHTQCGDNCNCELLSEGKMGPEFLKAIDLAEERRKEIVAEGGAVHIKGKI